LPTARRTPPIIEQKQRQLDEIDRIIEEELTGNVERLRGETQ
jgi:hypothetical protein